MSYLGPCWYVEIQLRLADLRIHREGSNVHANTGAVFLDLHEFLGLEITQDETQLLQRHFGIFGDETQRVVDRVRRRVHVRLLDLSREAPLRTDYDLILCRNVVIYFERPMQERLFRTFAEALVPGGFLVLGKVETLFGSARDHLALMDPRERLYRRPA